MQDGIVIQNATDLNEFVWVPVGEIKNDATENTTNKTTITLGRYSNFTVISKILPTPEQAETAYDTLTPVITDAGGLCFIEISSDFAGGTFGGTEYSAASSYENTKLTSDTLREWITTTIDNGGYYIARYEASKNGVKAASKATTIESTIDGTVTDGMLWNNITQPNAAIAAKAMYPYSSSAKYYSDLINSYAWDTAIIFIEAYSGDTDYADQDGWSINTNIAKAGENADKRCNIQDMAGNVREWSTETCTNGSDFTCTFRGGFFGDVTCSSLRGGTSFSSCIPVTAFRCSLCVK